MGNLGNYLYKCLISNNLEVPRPHSPMVHLWFTDCHLIKIFYKIYDFLSKN